VLQLLLLLRFHGVIHDGAPAAITRIARGRLEPPTTHPCESKIAKASSALDFILVVVASYCKVTPMLTSSFRSYSAYRNAHPDDRADIGAWGAFDKLWGRTDKKAPEPAPFDELICGLPLATDPRQGATQSPQEQASAGRLRLAAGDGSRRDHRSQGGPGAIRRKGDDPATDIPVDDAPPAQTNGEAYFSEEELRGQKQLPPPPLRGIILSRFKDVEIRRRRWIVPNYIPDETVTLLSGDGGIGKSLIAKQLAVARALSREWIGLMPEPGRTLMLSCEDDEDELLRRIDSIRKFHGAEWEDLDDFLPIDLVGEDSILGLLKQGIIEPTPMYRSLDVTMGDFKPGLTILDVLADLFCGDERVRTQARQFMNLLKALCRRHR
jgi:hypothetical protein